MSIKRQDTVYDASSENTLGFQRFKTGAAKRYASVDQEERESDISMTSYMSQNNVQNLNQSQERQKKLRSKMKFS